jgi:hypothetical protein
VAEKVNLRFSAAAARFIGTAATREDRLRAARGAVELPASERLHLVFYLCSDPDQEVSRLAHDTLRGFDDFFLKEVLADPSLQPQVVDALVKLHGERADLLVPFLDHPALTPRAAAFLAEKGNVPAASDAEKDEESEEIDEDRYLSKFQMAQAMGVSEKIKMALTGDKEWRTLLIKDANKLVSSSVVKNPRLTDAEVLTIAKSAGQNDEIMRVICANKEWVKNYQVRKALVENHKTPLPAALRFVATLSEKDLSALARSKNVSSVVASQARRILMSKSNGR